MTYADLFVELEAMAERHPRIEPGVARALNVLLISAPVAAEQPLLGSIDYGLIRKDDNAEITPKALALAFANLVR